MKIQANKPRRKKFRDGVLFTLQIEREQRDKARELSKKTKRSVTDCLLELRSTKDKAKNIIKRGDVGALVSFLDSCKTDEGYVPCQLIGLPGTGKSFLMKQAIHQTDGIVGGDGKYKFVVIDPHSEYDFLPTETIPEKGKIKKSFRVCPDEGLAFRDQIFEVNHSSKILSRKWDENTIFVLEEAHRFKGNAMLLMQEMRKFGRLLVINPVPVIKSFPVAEVVK